MSDGDLICLALLPAVGTVEIAIVGVVVALKVDEDGIYRGPAPIADAPKFGLPRYPLLGTIPNHLGDFFGRSRSIWGDSGSHRGDSRLFGSRP